MIKKILVPIAFSKYSKGILNYAAELAGATGAELLVVNVINERDLEAVDKIKQHNKPLARDLRMLVRDYRFDQIQSLLLQENKG